MSYRSEWSSKGHSGEHSTSFCSSWAIWAKRLVPLVIWFQFAELLRAQTLTQTNKSKQKSPSITPITKTRGNDESLRCKSRAAGEIAVINSRFNTCHLAGGCIKIPKYYFAYRKSPPIILDRIFGSVLVRLWNHETTREEITNRCQNSHSSKSSVAFTFPGSSSA